MAVCVPNFRSVSFFVWPGCVTQINKQIHTYPRPAARLTWISIMGKIIFVSYKMYA